MIVSYFATSKAVRKNLRKLLSIRLNKKGVRRAMRELRKTMRDKTPQKH